MQDIQIKCSNKEGLPYEVTYSQESPSLKTILRTYFEEEDALWCIYNINPIFQNDETQEIQNVTRVERATFQCRVSNPVKAVVQQKKLKVKKLPISSLNDLNRGDIIVDFDSKPNKTNYDLQKKFVTYCNKCKENVQDLNLEKMKECKKCKGQMIIRCLKCNLRFRKYHKVLEHLKKNCRQDSLHNCRFCDYTTYIKTHLFSHLKSKHSIEHVNTLDKTPGSTFECSKCRQNCDNSTNLKKHEKSCPEATSKCPYCQYSSNSQNLLAKHLRKVHGKLLSDVKKSQESPFLYGNDLDEVDDKPKINVKESKHESAKVHLNEEERNRLDSLIEIQCVNCNKVNNSDNLHNHHMQCQQANKTYYCLYPECGMIFSKLFNLQRHIIIGHLSGSVWKKCKFPKCDKTFGYQRNTRDHKEICGIQETQPNLDCKYCEFKTKTVRYLNRHIMTRHRNSLTESYTCEECSNEFVTMSSFEYHKKRCYKPMVVDIED